MGLFLSTSMAVLNLALNAAMAPPWPNCAVRSGMAGAPAIVINGAPYAPLLFVANNQFGRDEVLVQELRQAAAAKIMLFAFNLQLDGQMSAEQAAAILDTFSNAHPDGYFLVRIWLGPNGAWIREHPEECITKFREGGEPERLPLASPSSELWRTTTANLLRKRLMEILEGPHAGRFLGVTLDYLQTGEWFYPDTDDFMDYSPANLRAFRAWLKRTYKRNKALRQAWNRPDATLEAAEFPTPEMRDAAAWGPFRDPVMHRPAIDMQRFQNDLIADTIAYFAAVVKEVTRRRSLVGVYYGYTMELNENGPRALAQSGHLALGKLLECKDVDLLHAPFSYFERGLGQPGHLHAPVDSVALHGKLHLCEEDTFTHLSQPPTENLIAPGWSQRTQSSAETWAVVARDFGNALTHRCGMWLFDLLSDGRWLDESIWRSATEFRRMAAELRTYPVFQPEVACLIDERSPNLLRANTYPILIQSLSRWRAELDRIGTPVGYYLQSDLPRLPASVKVLVLADAFQVDKEERRALRHCLDRGAMVIWNYAPDLAGPEGLDVSRVGAITGIQVEAKFDTVPMNIVNEFNQEVLSIDPQSWRPRFVVTSTDGDVVARYQETGEVSAAAKPASNGVSLYTASPRLSVALLREICRRAGVHLYRNTPGMTGVLGNYLVVHTTEAGQTEFYWPRQCRHVERIVPSTGKPVPVSSEPAWVDTLPANTTAVYRCQ